LGEKKGEKEEEKPTADVGFLLRLVEGRKKGEK